MDDSFLETAIFRLWSINIMEYVRVKVMLAKNFHIQPSELDRMVYWEYEYFIKILDEIVKKENEEQEAKMKEYESKSKTSKYKPPKTPTAPKMPSYNHPKF